MPTEYDDSQHYGVFTTSPTLTSNSGKAVRQSELTLAALRAAGVFGNMEDGVVPPSTDKLWLDKNFDPAVLKEWDPTGSAWMPMTFDRLFGRAAVTSLAIPAGSPNALVVNQPANFMNNRLYSLTPSFENTGPTTIQVLGVGTYPVRYEDGSEIQGSEFTAGNSTILLFTGETFVVLFTAAGINIATAAAEAAAIEASMHATGAVDYAFLAGPTASLAAAVNAGALIPIVGAVRRVSGYDSSQPVQPFNVVCVATGDPAVPLPGAYQKDGSFGIGTFRFRVTQDAFQADTPRDLSPVYVEQFLTGFHGRGMLAAETPSIVTEQTVAVTHGAGEGGITATDATNFLVGACVTIQHDNGRYWTYFVTAKAGNVLGLVPALRWPCTAGVARLERAWFNQAHPGKFYMRQLAQRIAHSPEYEVALPKRGRAFFDQLLTGAPLSPINDATINYFDENSIAQGDLQFYPEFVIGRDAFITCTAEGQGGETIAFPAPAASACILRVVVGLRQPSSVTIRIVDNNHRINAQLDISGQSARAPRVYDIPFHAAGDASSMKVQFISNVATGQNIIPSQIEVFESDAGKLPVILPGSRRPVVIGLGDSWIGGDEVSTPERESIMTQLAKELPFANVVNAGAGGATIYDLHSNFDTIFAAARPDFVVLNTATNDSYNPSSVTFDPTAISNYCYQMQRMVSRIQALGAKPIIIGPPGLAEADAGSGYTDWILNERSRKYSRWLYARLAGKAVATEAVEFVSGSGWNCWKRSDGEMYCEANSYGTRDVNTAAGPLWTSDPLIVNFLEPFTSPPAVTATQDITSNRWCTVSNITTTSAVVRVWGFDQSDVAGAINIRVTGR